TLKAFKGKEWAIQASERLQNFGDRLHFVSQDSPEGYGHAVYQAKKFVGDDPFLLMLGDHIYLSAQEKHCATQLIEKYEQSGLEAMSAAQATPANLLHLFGTLKGEPWGDTGDIFKTQAIMEKP